MWEVVNMKHLSPAKAKLCQIPISQNVLLEGQLALPEAATGLVLFVHGSGSSRHSPRNQLVARVLQEAGLATLLMDLLTPQEEEQDSVTAHLRFNIPLLTGRVMGATSWLRNLPETASLKMGYFGASTGAAAALQAAAELPQEVAAVVSRGGRPDLAGQALSRVLAPTLLLVGALDATVIELNRQASALLQGEKRLELIQGATHLFAEPGTLEQVAQRAQEWFARYLSVPSGRNVL
jgi:dienelactone hydrolase